MPSIGQAPILKMLADRFTLGDNFHQSFHGGTGANHFMLGTGDAGFWSDGNGNPTVPPSIAKWSSDYPHPVSTWPKSLTVIEETFEGVPEAERDLMVEGNAARIWNL